MTTLDHLRRYTVTRSLFKPVSLKAALRKLGFVQADPIRAPARAQDLTLRHRVTAYQTGDLERLYPKLGIAEDFFTAYGFLTPDLQVLMHPRIGNSPWSGSTKISPAKAKQQQLLLDFVRERGSVHPRAADEHFGRGKVTNAWGGTSSATTHMLESLHYRGLLKVVRREQGVRIYSAHQTGLPVAGPLAVEPRLDALIDLAVGIYAPLPATSLASLIRDLHYGVPQWRHELTGALCRAKERLSRENVDGIDWYWPSREKPTFRELPDVVRFLAPFDPVVRDRTRFTLLWGWEYRFEAYTPQRKRKFGYYALPLLWRDRVLGWANVSLKNGDLETTLGYATGHPPKDRIFQRELEAEVARIRIFLGIGQ